MNKRIASFAAVCALWIGLAAPIFANDETSRGQFIPLWSGQAPGETAPEKPEISETDPKTGIKWIAQVWKPEIELFPAPADKNTGIAVLVCPGGGYGRLAYGHEGLDVARWLNSIGVTAAILKYRVPTRAKMPRGVLPLKDAQRAISLLRARAGELKILPDHIGILGFSAGGHLGALTSTASERTYPAGDATDGISCRPDFTVLVYPAYMTEKNGALRKEFTANASTPPAFCLHAADDSHTSDSSLFYFHSLRRAKIPAELHIYASGGHGYGFKPNTPGAATLPQLEAWIKKQSAKKPGARK